MNLFNKLPAKNRTTGTARVIRLSGCCVECRADTETETKVKIKETFKPLMQTAEITPKSNEPKTRQGADNKVSISVS